MSKIALEGNASGTGTLTIASQNTNSNYTLTLPNSTGTLVVTGGAQTIEFAAGSAASPSITFTGDTNTGIFSPGADTIAFSEGGVESMRIDSSGNVRIGTTATLSTYRLVTRTGNIAFEPANGNTDMQILLGMGSTTSGTSAGSGIKSNINVAFEGSNDNFYQGFGYVTTTANQTRINSAADFYIETKKAGDSNPTERMRIDSSGNVGIGTSSPSSYFSGAANLVIGNASGNTGMTISSGTSSLGRILFADGTSGSDAYQGWVYYTHADNAMSFGTAGSERARITSGGEFLVGTTSAALDSSPGFKFAYNSGSSNEPQVGIVANRSTNVSVYHLYNTNATNNGYRWYVNLNGGVSNYSGNNVNLSDERAKTNIELAGNYLDKICSIPVKLFNYKDEPDNEQKSLGVIAQDVEAVAPELVNNDGWLGEEQEDGVPLKSVYETDMMFALMKSIQELKAITDAQATRIEALEAEVAALKGQ